MGLLSPSHTVVRFMAPPPSKIDREAFVQSVKKRAFRDADPGADDATEACGWVGIHDPLFVDFTTADLFFQHYVVLGFRHDRRAVPAKLLYLERKRAELAKMQEMGWDRLGRTIRNEIKEQVQARLMLRALPVPRLFDCVWNLETGRVMLTGKAKAVREAFQNLFRESFGVQPVPMIPYLTAEFLGLPERVVEAVRASDPSILAAEEPPLVAPDGSGVPRLPIEEAAS